MNQSGAQYLVHDGVNRDKAHEVYDDIHILNLVELNRQELMPLDARTIPSYMEPEVESVGWVKPLTVGWGDWRTILFTSGTTGRAKGAVLTHRNHWANAVASALNLGLYDDDVWLLCMPLFHIGGLAILNRSVLYGHPVVLHEGFDAEAVNRAVDEERVTLISMVSTMLRRVIAARGDRPFPPTLRCILLGGGPAPRDLLSQCVRLTIPVAQTYGLTEAASQVATLAPQDALYKFGSAGKPLMGIEIEIEKQGEKEEVGEILVRGETVMSEYVNDREASARVLRDGWLHTGDLGYLDEDGYLFVVARREDLIVSGGENVYPAEIENALNAHPAVLESAVVGVDDPEWVQVPIAYIVLREGQEVSREELQSYCIECMARFKVPAQYQFIEALPRNAAGKLLRQSLVADWNSKHAGKHESE